MKETLIIIFTILTTNCFSQTRVIDLVFSNDDCGKYAKKAADLIEQNEIASLYNILSFEFDYNAIDFEHVNKSINEYYRPNKTSSPGYLNVNKLESDTCFFERHYYLEIDNEIKWLGQLIITSTNNETDNPISRIEYISNKEFIDRTEEITIAFNGEWMNKELRYRPYYKAKRKVQDEPIKTLVSRKINTSYINNRLNFGFEIDTTIWKRKTIPKNDIVQLFNGEYLERLEDSNQSSNSIDVAIAKLSVPILETKQEFVKTIKKQLNDININDLSFSNISYDKTNSLLEFNSKLKIDQMNDIYSKHLFFEFNLEEAIYIKINSNDLMIVNELSNKIRNTMLIK